MILAVMKETASKDAVRLDSTVIYDEAPPKTVFAFRI